MKRCLAVLLIATLLLGLAPLGGALAASQYATVVGGWLRLRERASFTAATITSYYTGTNVKLLGATGRWYKVETPDGRVGFMYGDYLQLNSGGYTPTGKTNATVVSGNGYGVRMRSGPSTSYSVLRKWAVGTRVEILERGVNWCRINVGGYVGYMMSQFLNVDGSGSSVYDGDATVWSSNGYGVRLRSGAGTQYSIIGVYSVGTQVRILERYNGWYKIQIGSRVGYMMSKFLSENVSYQVKAVTINNATPVVGNILAVQSVQPSSATVTYEWIRRDSAGKDSVVGTNASYQLTEQDANCCFRLRVTGSGRWYGSAESAFTSNVGQRQTINGVTLNHQAPVVGDRLEPVTDPAAATYGCVWKIDGNVVSNYNYYVVPESAKGKKIELTLTGTGAFNGSSRVVTSDEVQTTGTVSDVSIANATTPLAEHPNVGDKLQASYQPVTANVAFKWEVKKDGAVVATSTEKTLEMKAEYKGCTVTLTVTGQGAYSGSGSASTLEVYHLTQLTNGTIDKQPAIVGETGNILAAVVEPREAEGKVSYQWYADDAEIAGATAATYTVQLSDENKVLSVKITGNGVDYSGTVKASTNKVLRTPYNISVSNQTGSVGEPFSAKLTANGSQPITWELGQLPAGLSFDQSSATISGVPTAEFDQTVSVRASNAAGSSDSSFRLTVEAKREPKLLLNGAEMTSPVQKTFTAGDSVNLSFTSDLSVKKWTVNGVTTESGLTGNQTGAAYTVTGEARQNVTLTVTVEAENGLSKTGTVELTVQAKPIDAESVTLSADRSAIGTGESATLTAQVLPANATNKNVEWAVTPGTNYTLTDGVFTADKAGSYAVIAKVMKADGSYVESSPLTISVSAAGVPATSVTLSADATSLSVNGSATLTAQVAPEDATNKNVEWAVSPATGYTLSGNVFTAQAAGTYTIVAKVKQPDDSYLESSPLTISVSEGSSVIQATGVNLSADSVSITTAQAANLTASLSPEGANVQSIVWTVSPTTGATVDGSGTSAQLTATAPGSYTVTATATNHNGNPVSGNLVVTVTDPVTAVIEGFKAENPTNAAIALTLKLNGPEAVPTDVQWFVNSAEANGWFSGKTSDGTKIAFTPQAAGDYQLYAVATVNGEAVKSATVTLHVLEASTSENP